MLGINKYRIYFEYREIKKIEKEQIKKLNLDIET